MTRDSHIFLLVVDFDNTKLLKYQKIPIIENLITYFGCYQVLKQYPPCYWM